MDRYNKYCKGHIACSYEHFKELLTKLDLVEREVVFNAGLLYNQLDAWKRQKAEPNFEILLRLANIMHINVLHLLDINIQHEIQYNWDNYVDSKIDELDGNKPEA